MEILFEILAEVFIQVVAEVLAEFGVHLMNETRKEPLKVDPIIAVIGYSLWGALFAGISYFIFPSSFIASAELRMINLIASPIVMGLIMVKIGERRVAKNGETLRINHFAYGYLFALVFALLRWRLTR